MKPMETNRLILRGPCTADAQSIMEIRNSEFVLRYNAMCPYSLERTAQQLERDRESMLVLERSMPVTLPIIWRRKNADKDI